MSFTNREKDIVNSFRDLISFKKHIVDINIPNTPTLYYAVNLTNHGLFNRLLSAGLTPNKSNTLGALDIPREYFWLFFRGYFEGDGNVERKYNGRTTAGIRLTSGSLIFLEWLQKELRSRGVVKTKLTDNRNIGKALELRIWACHTLYILEKAYRQYDDLVAENLSGEQVSFAELGSMRKRDLLELRKTSEDIAAQKTRMAIAMTKSRVKKYGK